MYKHDFFSHFYHYVQKSEKLNEMTQKHKHSQNMLYRAIVSPKRLGLHKESSFFMTLKNKTTFL